ncbi:hypothetical protein PBY51_001194 [Eleginops maclovinus]|uniref:Uncharacterized protein n=1 Tax=Eleginops maclovinus TaxID=56733 RepID=A0AAN7XQZ2_ELEMC|nr:hypothetical protein PBY51_001194 [Eleginops maclovinus]
MLRPLRGTLRAPGQRLLHPAAGPPMCLWSSGASPKCFPLRDDGERIDVQELQRNRVREEVFIVSDSRASPEGPEAALRLH